MTYSLLTEISVAASPARVFDGLCDFPAYAAYCPLIVRLQGRPRLHEELWLSLRFFGLTLPPQRARITTLDRPRAVIWEGGVPGLMWAVHRFELEPEGTGTRLIHREDFTGRLAPLLFPVIKRVVLPIHHDWNAALKVRFSA